MRGPPHAWRCILLEGLLLMSAALALPSSHPSIARLMAPLCAMAVAVAALALVAGDDSSSPGPPLGDEQRRLSIGSLSDAAQALSATALALEHQRVDTALRAHAGSGVIDASPATIGADPREAPALLPHGVVGVPHDTAHDYLRRRGKKRSKRASLGAPPEDVTFAAEAGHWLPGTAASAKTTSKKKPVQEWKPGDRLVEATQKAAPGDGVSSAAADMFSEAERAASPAPPAIAQDRPRERAAVVPPPPPVPATPAPTPKPSSPAPSPRPSPSPPPPPAAVPQEMAVLLSRIGVLERLLIDQTERHEEAMAEAAEAAPAGFDACVQACAVAEHARTGQGAPA